MDFSRLFDLELKYKNNPDVQELCKYIEKLHHEIEELKIKKYAELT